MAEKGSSSNNPQATNESTDQLRPDLKRTDTKSSSASRWKRGFEYVKSLRKPGGSNGSRTASPVSIGRYKENTEVGVSEVSLPAPNVFNNPNSPFFLRRDGSPIQRANSVRPGSSNASKPTSPRPDLPVTPTTTGFQWKPMAVINASDVKDPEAQSRVENLIMRCGLDDIKITPQEAYDALREAKGSVSEAFELIKRGAHIYSSAVDDPEVREHLQDIGVLPPEPPRDKKVRFSESKTYFDYRDD